MRVTIKGQVTIPKDVRDTLGLASGSEVLFIVENGEARIRRAKPLRKSRGRRLVQSLQQAHVVEDAVNGLSTDELLALLRGDA